MTPIEVLNDASNRLVQAADEMSDNSLGGRIRGAVHDLRWAIGEIGAQVTAAIDQTIAAARDVQARRAARLDKSDRVVGEMSDKVRQGMDSLFKMVDCLGDAVAQEWAEDELTEGAEQRLRLLADDMRTATCVVRRCLDVFLKQAREGYLLHLAEAAALQTQQRKAAAA